MRLTEWKEIAERECYKYRDNCAYVQGVLDAGKLKSDKMFQRARWALAVENVKEYLEQHEPVKAKFFTELFGIDRPPRWRGEKRSITAMSLTLHVDRSSLYKWKSEALMLVLISAAQTGALRPYGVDPKKAEDHTVCNQ